MAYLNLNTILLFHVDCYYVDSRWKVQMIYDATFYVPGKWK